MLQGLTFAVGLITIFFILPLGVYQSWLLYNHVHATELMWFIWWIIMPLSTLLSIILQVAKSVAEKHDGD